MPLDVDAIRSHFFFPERGRIVTNNAASTQPPRELVQLYQDLAPGYENVHRGQSDASQAMTTQFEASFDTIAQFINAPSRENVAVYRNATEALNSVMYSLMTEFRDGDNVVTTMMEHNSNYVPWHGLCQEILPKFGIRVQCRLVPFDPDTGELDLAQLAAQVDDRTKLVCCTGASNFLGTKTPLDSVRRIAAESGYRQPDGDRRSRVLIDGAQLVPSYICRRPGHGRRLPGLFVPQDAGAIRRRRLYAKRRCLTTRSRSSTGATWSLRARCTRIMSATTACRGSLRLERPISSVRSRPPRPCDWS